MQWREPANELVMRDLVDALIQEELSTFSKGETDHPPADVRVLGLRDGEQWYRVGVGAGRLWFRVTPAAALQQFRFARSPVWYEPGAESEVREVPDPAHLLELVLADEPGEGGRQLPGGERTVAELRAAVEHAAQSLSAYHEHHRSVPETGAVLAGERLAATRDRPFHPTARASSGWSADEHGGYGPMRTEPLTMRWAAVRRDRLRTGSGSGSDGLHVSILGSAEQERVADMMTRHGLPLDDFQPLPVHPWQWEHVLPRQFEDECAGREVVLLPDAIGDFRPTASLRTLVTEPEAAVHLKLPLDVSTLGAARLLPPRYLDNGDRAQRTMRLLRQRDDHLRRLVRVSDESVWVGWQLPYGEDEFADRPGHLAAQVRRLPADLIGDRKRLVLPMAALAAHEWEVLTKAFTALHPVNADRTEFALELFSDVAGAFCLMGLSFLRFGVFPELHGQNVLVTFTETGLENFVLRDHDALRLYPEWMAAEGIPDPAYRLKPGGSQSLSLSSAESLLSYLQTLGFQVNLYGIADALARWSGVQERRFWEVLRAAVERALVELPLPTPVLDLLERELLAAEHWPSRQILGPLLRQPPRGDVSMPACPGLVPNPLAGLKAVP